PVPTQGRKGDHGHGAEGTQAPGRRSTLTLRILLFTGKGGVGKTTLAAATAARLAASGRKVLVVSTDPAHSLADAFGVSLGTEPSEVDTSLFAAHVDSRALVDKSWHDLRGQLRAMLAGAGLDE